ncbi:MAG: sulfatase-like hydrolase/transferase, partial [Phycisphaerae bacterium]|nr:sulfatase-like hydrolase/transferase [Phycisphaerae bacterium]
RQGHQDPVLNAMYDRLSPIYRSFQPIIFTPKPLDQQAVVKGPDRPNVIVIMVESWRADVFDKGLMPRLEQWSRQGLRLNNHYAGSYRSESGMFALLYGRSPIVYRPTLDAGIPPQLNETLRRSGYLTAYYSGHPKKWWWREKFVNPQTFDRFVHNDKGSWPDWDRKALRQMTKDVNQSDQPMFALCFLMSSHLEYQYPPEHEHHTPVERSIRWTPTNMPAVGPEHREPLYNRYRNTMAFLDEEIHRAIRSLDPDRNIVIVMGDHGEAIGENDHFGHYHMYGDISSRTPAVMVGPGLSPRRVDSPTVHQDLLPTLMHALNGQATPMKHVHGRDLFQEDEPRRSLLLVNYDQKWTIKVRLVHEDLRLFMQLFDDESALEIVGLEDAHGQSVINHGLKTADVDRWADLFEAEMTPFLN